MEREVVLYQDAEGRYAAECLSLEGCIVHADTEEEAMVKIKDAIKSFVKAGKEVTES